MWAIEALLLIAGGYLWGSLSPAFLIVRWKKGINLRYYGSGNVGSSNVGEQLGRRWTLVVGCLDWFKGLAPAMLARAWGFDWGVVALVSLATVLGHNWSLYLGFVGGRGMATTIGLLFAWDVRLVVVVLSCLAAGKFLGQSALGAIIGLVLLAPGAWIMGDPFETVLISAALALVIAIKRLEANRLPLPQSPEARRAVLWRRLWLDRDVPPDQPWQERKRIG